MEKWRLETPIMLTFFTRHETLKRVFEIIKEVKPRMLFLVGDGPRKTVPGDKEQIELCKKILEDIPWECEVHRYYAEENRGILINANEGMKRAFEKVDKLIFLEDDMLCSQSFFWFCQELLKKYENDLRVQLICGQNIEEVTERVTADYFFAHKISSGCVGIWKRTYEGWNYRYPVFEDVYNKHLLESAVPKELRKAKYLKDAERDRDEFLKNPMAKSIETCAMVNSYQYNTLNIIPKYNMSVSIGMSCKAAHTADKIEKMPKVIQKLFTLKVYDYGFPLKYSEFVICDKEYDKMCWRILGTGHPLLRFKRNVEKGLRLMKYGGVKELGEKLNGYMKKKQSENSDING